MKVRHRGFTIVELLIVVVVIAIIAAITIVSYRGIQARANAAAVASFLNGVTKKLAISYINNSSYPDTLDTTPEGAITTPSGMTVTYTPNNSSTPPSYTIFASQNGTTYTASNTTSPSQASLAVSSFTQELYGNQTLSGTALTSQVSSVFNDWGSGGPTGVSTDSFSARWTTNISIVTTGSYTFYVTSDDGQRLYINDTLVIDNWGPQGPTTKQYTVSLSAGQIITLKYEYYEITGGAVAKLEWMPAGGSRGVLSAT